MALQLRLQALSLSAGSEASVACAKTVAEYNAKVQPFEQEKIRIEATARDLEYRRDRAKARGKPFDRSDLPAGGGER